ncbi:MAG: DUF3179 domain-containing protein [Chloroflexi bacterium]|nr:DUF3179 domain-containing protein [Chloroflexota bacterium]
MQSIRNSLHSLRRASRARAIGLLALAAGFGLLLAGTACADDIQQVQSQQQTDAQEARASAQPAEESAAQQGQAQASAEPDESGSPAQDTAQPQQAAQAQRTQQAQQDQEDRQPATVGAQRPTFLPLDATETAEGIPIIRDDRRHPVYGHDWSTEWGIRIIEFDELLRGAVRDAIPALTGPRYVTQAEASTYYEEHIPLVQINVNGHVRGYPLEILTWHEIVNDVVGGVPVTVTFCPLCNTAIAFESQIGEEIYQFGVSGLLRNSDLVMYDRNTESLWQQSSGRAIVGRMVGARLKYVPASIVSFGQLRSAFPDALILSRETGWPRAYGQNPYRNYDDPETGGPYGVFFDRESIDPRLPPSERVVSIEGPSGAAIAYAWSALEVERVLHDSFDGIDLVVFWTPGARSALDASVIGSARQIGATAVFETSLDGRRLAFQPNPDDPSGQSFIDEQTGSTWDIFGRAFAGPLEGAQLTRVVHSDHFWFAWQAFHPTTMLRQLAGDDPSDG